MIETRRLKNAVMFLQTIVSFLLPRKIMNMYNDLAQKDGNVTVKDFRKYEKLEYKNNKTEIRHRLSQQLQTTWCVSKIIHL